MTAAVAIKAAIASFGGASSCGSLPNAVLRCSADRMQAAFSRGMFV
jgi:hypothetical protein